MQCYLHEDFLVIQKRVRLADYFSISLSLQWWKTSQSKTGTSWLKKAISRVVTRCIVRVDGWFCYLFLKNQMNSSAEWLADIIKMAIFTGSCLLFTKLYLKKLQNKFILFSKKQYLLAWLLFACSKPRWQLARCINPGNLLK